MATTTNYGWTTPDDTALVKDGAAAIRTLGSSVDTTTKNLNPETTLGDLAYRSSTANVKTRLGLGTANQVLRVNSGATAPEWATVSSGGMTLLNSGSTALSGNEFTISSIPSGYINLVVQLTDVYVSTISGLLVRLNGDSGNNYTYAQLQQNPAVSSNTAKGEPYFPNVLGYLDTSSSQLDLGFVDILFTNYLGTTGVGMFARGNCFAASAMRATYTQGSYNNSAAITSLTVKLESTHTFSGGNIYLYGVK